MTPDTLPPSPPPLPPALPLDARSPVPRWLWLLFTLGFVPVGIAVTAYASGVGLAGLPMAIPTGTMAGLICGLPFVGGLALAGRFFSSVAARIVGAVLFAALLWVSLAAVGYAGCVCLMGNGNFH